MRNERRKSKKRLSKDIMWKKKGIIVHQWPCRRIRTRTVSLKEERTAVIEEDHLLFISSLSRPKFSNNPLFLLP